MNPLKEELQSAMHYDETDEFDKAHSIVMHIEHPLAFRIHAYLHRKEGDLDNAQYWYDKLDEKLFDGNYDDERTTILKMLEKL